METSVYREARAYSRPFWITSFGFVKVCGICFFYLGKLHWFLCLLLSYYYDPDMFIFRWSSNFVKKVVLNESMAAKMASRALYIIIIKSEFEQTITNFVGAMRTTTTNCRVSFID